MNNFFYEFRTTSRPIGLEVAMVKNAFVQQTTNDADDVPVKNFGAKYCENEHIHNHQN